MMKVWWARVGSALSMAALTLLSAGCGGGGGGGQEPPAQHADARYYPGKPGDLWVYRQTSDGTSRTLRVKASGPANVHGTSALRLETYETEHAQLLGYRYVEITASTASELPPPTDNVSPAVPLLRYPITPGDTYPREMFTFDAGADFDGDGRNESIRVETTVRVIGFETVNTEIGPLPDAAHVRTTLAYEGIYTGGSPTARWAATFDSWYAENIGLAREEIVVRDDSGATMESESTVLVAHSVGGRKSDAVAPTATLVSPQAGVRQPRNVQFEVAFNEEMDVASLETGLRLIAPSGTAVTANVRRSYPAGQWNVMPWDLQESGTYTLRVDGASDLLGNAAQAVTWSFPIDAAAPVVQAHTPAEGAGGVPLDAVVALDFNEEVDISAAAVTMHSNDGAVLLDVAVEGARVTLTPQEPLKIHHEYTVTAWNVKDLSGNPMVQSFTLQFRTSPGGFDFAVPLSGSSGAEAMSVGDVNGDGRNDVVMATGQYPWDLWVYPQQPLGGFADPTRIPTRTTLSCPAKSVVVADLNGDGRQDVALGESGCGIEIFLQGMDGQLAAAALLPSADSRVIRARDLNGDGRTDLVGVGRNTGQVAVWLQGVDGQWALPTSHALDRGDTDEDMDIGDLNGDGHLDIVVTNGQYGTQTVSILLGQAGGTFGATQYLTDPQDVKAYAVAVGDFNHDGRDDLAYAGSHPQLSIMVQQADGTLGAPQAVSLLDWHAVRALEAVDVNGDGRADLVSAAGNSVETVLQQANGTLRTAERFHVAGAMVYNPQSLAAGDLNGDGQPDLVTNMPAYLVNLGGAGVQAHAGRKMAVPAALAPRGQPPIPQGSRFRRVNSTHFGRPTP